MTLIKSTVGCLALVNVVYFLWAHGVGQPPEPEVATTGGLKLAAEVPAAERASPPDEANGVAGSRSDAAAAPPTDDAPPSAHRCVSVGPFREMADAAHAASMLRAVGYDPRQRLADGDVWAGVWVYLAVPAGAAAGDQLLARLKGAGIDDALEMPGPADGSVISLGLYGEQKRAQARVAQVQALGLSPTSAERKRTGNVYWLDVDLKPTDTSLNVAAFSGEAGRITRGEPKACPSGDSP